jgi:hypothetical protein
VALVVQEALFRSFHREARPLSVWLDQRVRRPVLRRVDEMSAAELSAEMPDVLARDLSRPLMVEPPVLGATEQARFSEGGGTLRPVSESSRVGTHRFYFATQVHGDLEALQQWPDDHDEGLTPVDELPAPQMSNPPNPGDTVCRELAEHRDEQWFFHDRKTVGGPIALYTFVDVTTDEVALIATGDIDLKSVVDHELEAVVPIVTATAEQVRRFNEAILIEVEAAIRHRLGWYRQLDAARATLSWPEKWIYPPPVLEVVGEEIAVQTDQHPPDLELPPMRLSRASFDDMMRTVRIWASAAERYQDSLGSLHEDALSDLLACTLNAALPAANREVFTRSGKSDLFVKAEAIDEGFGPEKVFIGECKIWHGEARVNDAFDQLWGYLEVKDTSCLLLFFSRNADGSSVRSLAREKLVEIGGTVSDRSPIEGWPYVEFHRDSRDLTVCLAVVDIPPTKPQVVGESDAPSQPVEN